MNDDEMKLDSDRDYFGKHVVYWHYQVFIDEIGIDTCGVNNVWSLPTMGETFQMWVVCGVEVL